MAAKAGLKLQDKVMKEILQKLVSQIESLVKEAFNSFVKDYIQEITAIKTKLAQLKKSQNFLTVKFNEINEGYKKLNKSNVNSAKTTKTLTNKLTEMEKQRTTNSSKLTN